MSALETMPRGDRSRQRVASIPQGQRNWRRNRPSPPVQCCAGPAGSVIIPGMHHADPHAIIMGNMVQASRKWRKLAQLALAAHGISQAAQSALVWAHRLGGGTRQISLAGYVGIEGTSLVRLLDELSAAGLDRPQGRSERPASENHWLTSGRRASGRADRDRPRDLARPCSRGRRDRPTSMPPFGSAIRSIGAAEAHVQRIVPPGLAAPRRRYPDRGHRTVQGR